MKKIERVAAALFAAMCVTGAAGADGRAWLDELPLRDTMCGWGTPRANKSVDGNALRIGTQQFARGVGTHAESLSMWNVDGKAVAFDADVGVDAEVSPGDHGAASVRFVVRADGLSRDAKYVKGVTLNGKPFPGFKLAHEQVAAGGELVFEMTSAAPAPTDAKLAATAPALVYKGAKKRLVCLDLDATLCQHRSAPPPENLATLRELMKRYKCIMVGAGNAPRIYRQMGNFPIDILANYGMQESKMVDGEFRIVRQVTNHVDQAFFLRETDRLRKKYGYTEYYGKPVEFHASGMVTFGLLGTTPPKEMKMAFDPDKAKRRAMYAEVCEVFKDYSVFIGGSSSFDFAGPQYNKYDCIMAYAREHGYARDEIIFIGDDFGDGGGDSHVRLKGLDYIEIEDYRKFPERVAVLLK